MMMKQDTVKKPKAVIAVVNDKGGCGKSTSSFHIVGELARRGRKVLCVDADKQRNVSYFLLAEEESDYDRNNSYTVLDLWLEKQPFENVVKKNYIKEGNSKPRYMGIDVIPSDVKLKDQEMYAPLLKDKNFKGMFDGFDYDYVIIDCPPSNEMVERIVLEQLATHIIIPLSNDISSILGMGDLIEKIDQARQVNPDLKLIGAFYSMHLPSTRKSKMYYKAMESKFPQLFIKEYIPFCKDVKESLEDEGRPLAFYRKSKARYNYENLVSEILSRL